MIAELFLALTLVGGASSQLPDFPMIACTAHSYEAKIRLKGRVSTTQVQASDAGHAKKLVQAQFPTATVLSVKRID